jgi:periplasmic protein TonB
VLVAPPAIPSHIVRYVDEPSSSTVGFIPAGPGGNGGPTGLPAGFDFGMPSAGPPPPPPPPVAPPPPPLPAPESVPAAPVRRGGEVMQSNLIYMVKPVYPRLAMTARVQGTVILEAVITQNGTIDPARLRVLSGHPLLTPNTIEAVQQWRYRPTTLNGQALEILTTVTVNFSLN